MSNLPSEAERAKAVPEARIVEGGSRKGPEITEAGVEAVARRLFGELGEEPQLEGPENYRPLARKVLQAALPHLLPASGSDVLEDGQVTVELSRELAETLLSPEGREGRLGEVELRRALSAALAKPDRSKLSESESRKEAWNSQVSEASKQSDGEAIERVES